MTITVESKEMNAIMDIMIANDHYTAEGLYDLIKLYDSTYLLQAYHQVVEEDTLSTIIQFFQDNPEYYPVQVNK